MVLTLEMTGPNLMTLDFYHHPSMQLLNRTKYQHECEQAFIISMNTIICQDRTVIYELDIASNLKIKQISHLQGNNYIIVGIYYSSRKVTEDIEIYYQNNESRIKCVKFDLKECLTHLDKLIAEYWEEEPIFLQIQKQSSLLISKRSQIKIESIQELIMNSKNKRMLNKFPTFDTFTAGSTIATVTIALGKSQTITYPKIIDEFIPNVKIRQNDNKIPHSSQITKDQVYKFAPPLTAFGDLGTHKFTVILKDGKDQETTYYYSIVYTNTAPYFSPTPTTTIITTQFNKAVDLIMPSHIDAEGHAVTMIGIPTTTPYITFDSSNNKLSVNPIGAGQCGKTTFNYQLTDTNLNSASYPMTVEVTNSPPDFQGTYFLQPASNPYKLHVMDTLKLSVPALTDLEGGLLVLDPSDTPGAGATPLVFSHDPKTNILNIQSTQIMNCGVMNTKTSGSANHVIRLRIQDLCSAFKDYQISVDVSNTAPQFVPVGFTLASVEVPMNSVKQIDISLNINDADGDTISIGFAQMINNSPVSVPTMFSVIAPATININPTTFADVGFYNLQVEIYDYQPYSSFIYFDVNVINSPPVFLKNETIYDQKLRFNNTYEYLLLPYEDPEGSQVYLSQQSQPTDINDFASFFPLINPDRIIIYPNQWNQVKTYKVITTMTDTNKQTDYMWNLEIYNNPPYFNSGKKPASQKLRFNSTVYYPLPQFSDDEFNQIDVINNMPKFITFDSKQSIYVIAPSNPANDIGTFNVIGKLSDSQMETDFKFQVTVFNDPPFFKQPLVSTINLGVGFNYTYILPEAEDKEGMKFSIKCQIKSMSGPLPPFIKFSAVNKQFDIQPDKFTQVGSYDIEVILDDYYSQKNYRFRLNIQDPNKNRKNANDTTNGKMELIKANFKILSVSRDGKCSIKIIASKGGDQLTKFITYDTFKIVILTKNSEPVQYAIDSKDSKSNIVTLKLNFKNPQKISDSTELDRIEVRVDREPSFQTKGLLCFVPYDTKQQAPVPPQVNSAAASFAAKFKGGVQLISSQTTGGMAVNLSISFIIQYIWALLNDMSFLTINAMISITVPGTAKLIQMALLNFIYLDILQTDKWLIPLLFKEVESKNEDPQIEYQIDPVNEDEDGPLNDYFDENGFSNKYIIQNLGSTFVYFVFLLVSMMLVPILTLLESLWSIIKRFSVWLKKHMIWNFPLRFLVQQAPPISIACGINLYLLNFRTFDGTSISSVLSLIFIFCICAGKVIVFMILRKYQRNKLLQSKLFQASYGTLVDGLNLTNNIGIYWNLLILIRWSLTNTVLILLRDHNYGQIQILLIFSYIFQILMVYGKPYDDKLENQISLFNEVMVSAYLYVLMMLTDFLGDNLNRVEQGTALVAIILANVAVNFIKFFYGIFKGVKNYCHRKKLQRLQAYKLAQEKARQDELIRQLEEIAKILSNPKLHDPNYIPTIEEEQAIANRKLLFQGNPANFSPELKAIIEIINKMRFDINSVEMGKGFGNILKNWKGSNQKQRAILETTVKTPRFPTSIKVAENAKLNSQIQKITENKITKQNFKNLFKKEKQKSKKGQKAKSPEMNNNDKKNEWHFEDDYNANQFNHQQFQSGETNQSNFTFENKHLIRFQVQTTQEIHIKTKAMNLIEEEIKQKNELTPNLNFRFQSSKQETQQYEPQQWWAKR